MEIGNAFFQPLFVVFHAKSIRSTKTGARERSITKSYFISEADSSLKFTEESAFNDNQIKGSKRTHGAII